MLLIHRKRKSHDPNPTRKTHVHSRSDREIEVLQDIAILSIIQEEKIKELKDLLTVPTLKSRQVISPKMQSIYKDEHVRRKDIEARITELQKGVEG